MLPTPNTYRKSTGGGGGGLKTHRGGPRIFFPPTSPSLSAFSVGPYRASPSSLFAALRARTRVSNLGVTVLSLLLFLSVTLNFLSAGSASSASSGSTRGWFLLSEKHNDGWAGAASLAQHRSGRPLSIETTIERDARFAQVENLIMVPGHAIWTGRDPGRVMQDEQWVLQPMQRGGSVKTFLKHIEEGAETLRLDPKALLVFSGGATRSPPAPPLSEAYSYHSLASTLALLPSEPIPADSTGYVPLPVNLRAVTEEFALDSYQNLLFSLARFHEVTGRWPEHITVVGYGMKRRRFTDLHRAAIGWPAAQWSYVGIDDEGDTTEQYAGELKYGYTPFLSAPSGCHPPLSIKRVNRNPFSKYHPYHVSCPELAGLLEWCPAERVVSGDEPDQMETYAAELPWRDTTTATVWKADRME